ncbi:MAG: hypothetical protein R3D90_17120 [Paracoccaceae bacterium]
MRGMAGLAVVAMLAGCAMPMGGVEPQAARLSQSVLTVSLSDGTVCRADWAAAGGAGRLEPCGPGYDYRVTVVERPNLLRQFWSELTRALGAEGVVPPMASVEITDGAGSWTFASPPPVE